MLLKQEIIKKSEIVHTYFGKYGKSFEYLLLKKLHKIFPDYDIMKIYLRDYYRVLANGAFFIDLSKTEGIICNTFQNYHISVAASCLGACMNLCQTEAYNMQKRRKFSTVRLLSNLFDKLQDYAFEHAEYQMINKIVKNRVA